MRGTPCNFPETSVAPEIIPAYAGNTLWSMHASPSCGDHPRVCGEHPYRIIPIPEDMGSSPRMRGTLHVGDAIPDLDGIIPAYAGNTSHPRRRTGRKTDHPRVCEEHFGRRRVAGVVAGSSPRMRGTPWLNPSRMSIGGIIPAYAGNTDQSIIAFPSCGDHPRVCGEHSDRPFILLDSLGSSPRMRGTPFTHFSGAERVGIIPAYAGNTCPNGRGSRSDRDHPRVCGEHFFRVIAYVVQPGSSPRMRGTH